MKGCSLFAEDAAFHLACMHAVEQMVVVCCIITSGLELMDAMARNAIFNGSHPAYCIHVLIVIQYCATLCNPF